MLIKSVNNYDNPPEKMQELLYLTNNKKVPTISIIPRVILLQKRDGIYMQSHQETDWEQTQSPTTMPKP